MGKHREQLRSAAVSCQRHGQEEEDEVGVPGQHGHQARQQAAGLGDELGAERSERPAHTRSPLGAPAECHTSLTVHRDHTQARHTCPLRFPPRSDSQCHTSNS